MECLWISYYTIPRWKVSFRMRTHRPAQPLFSGFPLLNRLLIPGGRWAGAGGGLLTQLVYLSLPEALNLEQISRGMCTAQWEEGRSNICRRPLSFPPRSLSIRTVRGAEERVIWRFSVKRRSSFTSSCEAPYLNHCTLMFSYLKWSFVLFYNAKVCEYIVAYIMCRIFVRVYIRAVGTERFQLYR